MVEVRKQTEPGLHSVYQTVFAVRNVERLLSVEHHDKYDIGAVADLCGRDARNTALLLELLQLGSKYIVALGLKALFDEVLRHAHAHVAKTDYANCFHNMYSFCNRLFGKERREWSAPAVEKGCDALRRKTAGRGAPCGV